MNLRVDDENSNSRSPSVVCFFDSFAFTCRQHSSAVFVRSFVRLFWEEGVERFIYLFVLKELFIIPESLRIIICAYIG